jgi:hypothetical protein
MRRLLLFALLLSAQPVLAQTAPVPVPLQKPMTAVFTHDGIGTDGYRLYLDGKAQPDVPASARANGEVSLAIPALTVGGLHTVDAVAFNAFGESAKASVQLYAGVPSAPGPLTITIVTTTTAIAEPQPDGSLKVRIDGVATTATVR